MSHRYRSLTGRLPLRDQMTCQGLFYPHNPHQTPSQRSVSKLAAQQEVFNKPTILRKIFAWSTHV